MSLSPSLRKPSRYRRASRPVEGRVFVFGLIIVVAFVGLVARLWFLQIYMGEELRQKSIDALTKSIPTRAPRGDIVDRTGKPLADSRQSLSLEVDPAYAKTNPDLLIRLAPLLGLTVAQLQATLDEEKGQPYAVRVAEKLTSDQVARLEENRLYLSGAIIQPNPIRNYPVGTVATHLLGYLSLINDEELAQLKPYGYRPGDYVGKSGIEKRYNNLLRGTDGGRLVEVEPSGAIRRVLSETEARPGATLHLALDRRVQWAAQKALEAEGKAGAAVAIDPRNGEVLALASYPTYNIQPFATRRPVALWDPLRLNPNHPLGNRAIGYEYPPASTFKPFVAAAGLQSGALSPNTTVFCAGGLRIGKQWKACHKYHGWVNLEQAISLSCDTFFYTAAQAMGIDAIAQAAEEFGMGRSTGIDMGGEADGKVPTKAWRARVYDARNLKWYPGQTANVSIGQGELHATPLQVANAVAALANGGRLWQPHLLMTATAWNGQVTYRAAPKLIERVPINPAILARIRGAMRLAVTKGTAKMLAMPNVAVAAKTGTAQTRANRANHGWMTCFAPYEAPTIAIAVIVEGGIHGADSGGPVAKAMLQAYFNHTTPPYPAAPGAPVVPDGMTGAGPGAVPVTTPLNSPATAGAAPTTGASATAKPASKRSVSRRHRRYSRRSRRVPRR